MAYNQRQLEIAREEYTLFWESQGIEGMEYGEVDMRSFRNAEDIVSYLEARYNADITEQIERAASGTEWEPNVAGIDVGIQGIPDDPREGLRISINSLNTEIKSYTQMLDWLK